MIKIKAATTKDTIFCRVQGRATFTCSGDLRSCLDELLEGDFAAIVVDLKECEGMDSTFMGLLAMMVRKCKSITVANADAKNIKLLTELGLRQRLKFEDLDLPQLEWIEVYPVDDKPMVITLKDGELMLMAHEELMKICDGNIEKFEGVVEHIREDVERMRRDAQNGGVN